MVLLLRVNEIDWTPPSMRITKVGACPLECSKSDKNIAAGKNFIFLLASHPS